MAKLVDQDTGEERQLVKSVTLIGRAEYCDVCVPDRIVSREHARIRRRLTGYYAEDLGSTHGTRVNSVRIRRRAKLRDGDTITLAIVRGDQPRTSALGRLHTDTSLASREKSAPGPDDAAEDDVRVGATFIFRK